MIEKLYELSAVMPSGNGWVIFGERQALMVAAEEWREAINAVDGCAAKIIVVRGMANSCDRAEREISFRPEEFSMVTVTRYS